MAHLLMSLIVGGLGGLVAFVIGSALTDGSAWALAFGVVGFMLGFALWGLLSAKAQQDEHPTSSPG